MASSEAESRTTPALFEVSGTGRNPLTSIATVDMASPLHQPRAPGVIGKLTGGPLGPPLLNPRFRTLMPP